METLQAAKAGEVGGDNSGQWKPRIIEGIPGGRCGYQVVAVEVKVKGKERQSVIFSEPGLNLDQATERARSLYVTQGGISLREMGFEICICPSNSFR